MDETKIKKIIKKSLSFTNIEKNSYTKSKISDFINSKQNSFKYKKVPLKLKINKNTDIEKEKQNNIFFNSNSTQTIFEKINRNINKIKDINIKAFGALTKNIKNIEKELFHKKFTYNKNQYNRFNKSSFSFNVKNNNSNSIINSDYNKNKNLYNKIDDVIFNKTTTNSSYIKSDKDFNRNHPLSNNISIYSTTVGNIVNKSGDCEYNKQQTSSNFSQTKENNVCKKSDGDSINSFPINNQNLLHKRIFNIDERILRTHAYQLFKISPLLMTQNYFIKNSESQLKSIMNKIKLINSNLDYFKGEYLNKNHFNKAFNYMENKKKAEFNLIIEEICNLMLKLIPLLLKNFNRAMNKLLRIQKPDIITESLNNPKDEIECLKMNILFLNKVINYFNGCLELYKVIQVKITEFKYNINEFAIINIFLDLTRYNSSKLICVSNEYIQKVEQEEEIIKKFDIRNNNKKIDKDKEDDLERYHKRHRNKIRGDILKLNRINYALDLKNKRNDYCISPRTDNDKRKIYIKEGGLFNSYLINSMMKYFDKRVRNRIIAEQVIERYKSMENKKIDYKLLIS